MSSARTVGASLQIGVFTSLVFGTAAAIPVYLATADWVWPWLQLASAVGLGGWVAKALFVGGYQRISVPVYHQGVATRLGESPTGVLYEPGDHWGFPGVSGAILVDMRHQRIDLEKTLVATAADTSDVGVDSFVFVIVEDALKTLNVNDMKESVREHLEACIRLFTAVVSKAENAVQFRDLLAEYLELGWRTTAALTPEHRVFKERLDKLGSCIVPGGSNTLMEQHSAGMFKKLLHDWGLKVEEVEVEQYDVPKEVKAANVKKATQATLMDAEKIRNKARKEMIDELTASGVNANTAMNSVDLLLGLSVKKDIKEITITDLEKVASAFGGQIAGTLKNALASHQNP